jgi:hypothetical protein
MNQLLESLRGRKTYIAAGMGLLYIVGCAIGLWQWDEKVIAALGLSGLAFLRAGVNNTLAPVLAISLILATATGCRTAPPQQATQRMAAIAELAAYTGAGLDLVDHPQRRIYYEASVAALDGMLKDRNYSPAAFAAALQKLPVRELRGEKGALIVGAAVLLWDQYAAEIVNLDQEQTVKPVVVSVRNGLARALDSTK